MLVLDVIVLEEVQIDCTPRCTIVAICAKEEAIDDVPVSGAKRTRNDLMTNHRLSGGSIPISQWFATHGAPRLLADCHEYHRNQWLRGEQPSRLYDHQKRSISNP